MKILAIVVTYYPEKELLEKNISAFIDNVDKVLIWENTPKADREKFRYVKHEKVEYHGDGINSISHALNYAWHYAKDNGFDYVLAMDQDSVFVDFNSYLAATIYNPSAPKGIWGPNAYAFTYTGFRENEKMFTSGMLIKIDLLNQLGGWNELFAIDCVDDELCLKAGQLGIGKYILGDVKLVHRLGNPQIVTYRGWKINLRNDSPSRLYSIYKSHVLMCRLFPDAKSYRAESKSFWGKNVIYILMFEKKKVQKLFAIFRGILSGMFTKID